MPARSGSSNGSSTLASNTPFAYFSSTAVGRRRRHAGALTSARLPGGDPCGALRGALGCQTLPLLRAQLVEGLLLEMLSGGQAATVSSMSPATTVGRRAAAS